MAGQNSPADNGGTDDLMSILGGTSAGADPADNGGASSGGPSDEGQSAQPFSFGGRSYASQKAAEQAHNALYGKFSDQQGILNKVKAALKDPEALEVLSQNPQFSDILAKLGIEQSREEVEQEVAADPDAGFDWSQVPEPMQRAYEEMQVERTVNSLDREERGFERKLGRAITDEEHDAVCEIISKAGSLSFEQAFTLAFHQRMLKDAVSKAKSAARPPSPARLGPLASMLPGTKIDPKKRPEDMNSAEWREHLRNSPELRQLLSQ